MIEKSICQEESIVGAFRRRGTQSECIVEGRRNSKKENLLGSDWRISTSGDRLSDYAIIYIVVTDQK